MCTVQCARLRLNSQHSHISNRNRSARPEILLLFTFVIFLIGTFIVLSRVIFVYVCVCVCLLFSLLFCLFLEIILVPFGTVQTVSWMDIIELARVFLQTVWWTAKCGTHSAKSRIRKKSVQCFIAGWTERGISTIISTRGRREKWIVDAFTSFRIHRWQMLRMNLVTLKMLWILIEAICSLNLLKYTFMRDFSCPVSIAIASDKCSLVIAILYCLSLQMREMRKI